MEEQRQRAAQKRQLESIWERLERNDKNRERAALRRQLESPEKREERNRKNRERKAWQRQLASNLQCLTMVIDLDEQTSTPEVIVQDDDDKDNDAQITLGTTAEEENAEEESEEARRARIRNDIDRILYDQIDAEMDEPIVSILE